LEIARTQRKGRYLPIPAEKVRLLLNPSFEGGLRAFAESLSNPQTRRFYMNAVTGFLNWTEAQGLRLPMVLPQHIHLYIEQIPVAASTKRGRLSALRLFFDQLVTTGALPVNPTATIRGPRDAINIGKTPVLSAAEIRILLDSIPRDTIIGLRDRALMAVMLSTACRVGTVIRMRVEDYFTEGCRGWLRVEGKQGISCRSEATSEAKEHLNAYLIAAGNKLAGPRHFLFPSVRGGTFTVRPMHRIDVWKMVRRRVEQAGINTKVSCHTFRVTGINKYVENGGSVEGTQRLAGATPLAAKGVREIR
jgi:site-specific recombinase XerD